MINFQNFLDDVKCYETVCRLRWPDGVRCPHCGAAEITKQGRDTTQPARRKYHCERCHRRFDDLTETVLAGRHQPLRVWILCLYFMGLNLSNAQIAQALGLNPDDVQRMTEQLRDGIVARQPEPILVGAVECDEVYVVAGHKGHPDAVKKSRRGRRLPEWFKETIRLLTRTFRGRPMHHPQHTFDRSQVGTASGLPVRAVLS